MTTPAVDAVTFDFWNTLFAAQIDQFRERRIAAWTEILAEAGHDVTDEVLDDMFQRVQQTFDRNWAENRQFHRSDAADLAVELLEVHVDGGVRERLTEAFMSVSHGLRPDLAPNVAACLDVLRDAGLRIGIVCDVGMTPSPRLRELLDERSLLLRFDHWSFSDEVGVYKPHPLIFEHALEGLGKVAPERAAHVGDLRRTDIKGALDMGMTAVRYVGLHDDQTEPPEGEQLVEAHHVITDHLELPVVLGIT